MRRILLIGLIVLGVGWGALGAVQGWGKVRVESGRAAVAFAQARFERDLCVGRAIRQAVPHGAAVWVAPRGNVFWRNSLGPMSTPNHIVLHVPQPGAYALTVVDGGPGAPAGIRCEGTSKVRYPPVVLVATEIAEPQR